MVGEGRGKKQEWEGTDGERGKQRNEGEGRRRRTYPLLRHTFIRKLKK